MNVVYKPPSQRYFVIAAQTDEGNSPPNQCCLMRLREPGLVSFALENESKEEGKESRKRGKCCRTCPSPEHSSSSLPFFSKTTKSNVLCVWASWGNR